MLAAQRQQELTKAQTHRPWSPHGDEQDETLRNALLAASAMSDSGTATHPPQTPRAQHPFSITAPHQPHDEPHWVSPMPFRPPLHSFHSFPGMRSDDQEHVHRLSFGTDHHHGNGPSLSQPLLHLDGHGHGFMDHQLSAVSAPEDFLHASATSADKGACSTGFTRAHSEPDPSLGDAGIDQFAAEQHVSVSGGYEALGASRLQSQGGSIAREMNLGGSFVEDSMEDVAG